MICPAEDENNEQTYEGRSYLVTSRSALLGPECLLVPAERNHHQIKAKNKEDRRWDHQTSIEPV